MVGLSLSPAAQDEARSCQSGARCATLVAMSEENYLAQSSAASALFLREAEVRRGIELLFFGHAHFWRAIDAALTDAGLGRAEYRALYFIARQPDLPVSALLRILAITKQSLGRVLNELAAKGMVETRAGETDRRQKLLRLTEAGSALEVQLFEALRAGMSSAYATAGQEAVTGFWRVLEGLVPEEERGMVMQLQGRGR